MTKSTGQGKSPQESAITMRQMVMPNQTNPQGTIFGGVVMSWIDLAAAMVAERHSRKPVVTVHVDDLTFKAPIMVGDHVIIKATLNYVGNTSMEVGVKVFSENPLTGQMKNTTKAYLTFVALDDQGQPATIEKVNPQNDDEKRRFSEAQERIKHRKGR